MKAIIVTGGKQYLVTEGTVLYVEKLDNEVNTDVTFNEVIYVDGKVASYDLVSYSFEPASPWWTSLYYIFGSPIVITFFISALLISYKEYEFNEKIISVYAGWYHHTLRIDGELYDEHNTIVSYSPIYLSTTVDDYYIEARITLTNRISVKVNDKLI